MHKHFVGELLDQKYVVEEIKSIDDNEIVYDVSLARFDSSFEWNGEQCTRASDDVRVTVICLFLKCIDTRRSLCDQRKKARKRYISITVLFLKKRSDAVSPKFKIIDSFKGQWENDTYFYIVQVTNFKIAVLR